MTSLKKNFMYSSILTTANYIFPLITFPYVSRVLGVNNIGLCNFIDGIINYFILFSMMGVSILGIREVAANKNDSGQLKKTFSTLLTINAITTFVGLIILAIVTMYSPRLNENLDLIILSAVKLVFNLFLIEWYFKGLESFKYVTIRSILVKCLYVISVFLFVKESTDYTIYYFLSVLMIVVNSMINMVYAHKSVSYSIKTIDIKLYIKPYITLGVYMLLTSMYVSFNVIFLGFTHDDIQVGYYTTATKLHSVVIALFTALTSVMLPRMSSLLQEGKIKEFKIKINKSIDILLSTSIPLIIFMIILAPQIVYIVSGEGYEGAITPLRIITPLCFIVGYEQILIIQAMMPLKMDGAILFNSIIGAVLGVVLNIMIIPNLASIGSAIVWCTCETIVLLFSQIAINKSIQLSFPLEKLLGKVVIYIPLALCLHIICNNLHNIYYEFIISVLFVGLYYTMIELLVYKNSMLTKFINSNIKNV